ncbi:MAG: glycosyltransferase [Candidatus Marinimicrobia bacterium]|nr:glycosyltransferase [Candidatus Neomarinimicrobiota bacterium]
MQFTVIMPTYNRGEIAVNTLQALQNQSTKAFKVIVVDQSDTVLPELRDFSSKSYAYNYLHVEMPSLPNARNIGIANIDTEYAIFLDDDCIPDENLVHAYEIIFKSVEPKIALVAGRVIEEGSTIFRERAHLVGGFVTKYGKTLKNFDTDQSGLCEWAPGGNFGVRTSAYREIGGFDTNYIGTAVMEDSDFGYSIRSIGYQVMYDPRPSMLHLRIPTGGLRQSNPSKAMQYRAHNSVYFFRKHGLKRFLPMVSLYIIAIAIKEWLKGNYSPSGIWYSFSGFIRGLQTPIKSSGRGKKSK